MVYRSLLRPLLFRLPPERAHDLTLHLLSFAPASTKFLLGNRLLRNDFGELRRFGLTFANPVGLAAGFDKDGIAVEALEALGFGFIEAGTVTYEPQAGNVRPRLFRLAKDRALINRAGFNNAGAAALAQRLSRHRRRCVVGVSIGKSRSAPLENAVADYLKSFEIIYRVADYIAINVSSPNTPGLRELQRSDHLAALLNALQQRNDELSQGREQPIPLLLKVSPDLTLKELEMIVDVVKKTKIAGIIATNTTTTRERLQTDFAKVRACGEGGLSGAPLRERATSIIASLYGLSHGSIPVVGVGGIFTAEDAWEKICAGATLVQLYTGFVYQGPTIAKEINDGLGNLLQRSGFASLDEAVGCRAEEYALLNS